MELVNNCANCQHFDGDAFCTLRAGSADVVGCLVPGFIPKPELVVCSKHEPKDKDGE